MFNAKGKQEKPKEMNDGALSRPYPTFKFKEA